MGRVNVMERLDFLSWIEHISSGNKSYGITGLYDRDEKYMKGRKKKKKDESYSGTPSFGLTGTHGGYGGKYMNVGKKKKKRKK